MILSYIKFIFRYYFIIIIRWGFILDNLLFFFIGVREVDSFDFRLLEFRGREFFLLSVRLMLFMKFREFFEEIGLGELVLNNSFVFRFRFFIKIFSRAVRVFFYK